MTYEQLEKLYHERKAILAVDHINHREFVYIGTRYFAGYSSERAGDSVMGWFVYKQQPEVKYKTYRLLNTKFAKLYIDYLLGNGFAFEVTPWISHVQIDVPDRADAPLTEWQITNMRQI
jgi:hypothetical protein